MKRKLKSLAKESVPDILPKIKQTPEYISFINRNQEQNKGFGRKLKLVPLYSVVFLLALIFLANSTFSENEVYALEYTSGDYHIQIKTNEEGEMIEIIPMNDETSDLLEKNNLSITEKNNILSEKEWSPANNENVPEHVRDRVEKNVSRGRGAGNDNRPNPRNP